MVRNNSPCRKIFSCLDNQVIAHGVSNTSCFLHTLGRAENASNINGGYITFCEGFLIRRCDALVGPSSTPRSLVLDASPATLCADLRRRPTVPAEASGPLQNRSTRFVFCRNACVAATSRPASPSCAGVGSVWEEAPSGAAGVAPPRGSPDVRGQSFSSCGATFAPCERSRPYEVLRVASVRQVLLNTLTKLRWSG
jgi:hypothetical protein